MTYVLHAQHGGEILIPAILSEDGVDLDTINNLSSAHHIFVFQPSVSQCTTFDAEFLYLSYTYSFSSAHHIFVSQTLCISMCDF